VGPNVSSFELNAVIRREHAGPAASGFACRKNGVAGLRSIFRAFTTAYSERPPPVRHAHGGALTGFLVKA
jgi:hypothetical protein